VQRGIGSNAVIERVCDANGLAETERQAEDDPGPDCPDDRFGNGIGLRVMDGRYLFSPRLSRRP